MGKVNILLANSTAYFSDDEVRTIYDAVQRAETYISTQFDEFNYSLDLLVAMPSYMQSTIPEDGICGRTFSSRLVTIILDKDQSPISADSVYEMTCHELVHSLRWEKLPEHSETLFDEMILEGLAVVFEEQAVKDAKGANVLFFLRSMLNTTQGEYEQMIKTLSPSLSSTKFDYNELFYSGNDSVPRWAGYKLGYYYVTQYLKTTGRTINQATFDSYKDFRKLV